MKDHLACNEKESSALGALDAPPTHGKQLKQRAALVYSGMDPT